MNGNVRRVLPLAFLAPEIVQTILAGKQPLDLTAKRLIRTIDLPLDWQTQKQVLGFR
jgi:site-specific DNA recombinase